MSLVGIEATINKWDEPLALGIVDPHDSLSHPAGVSDVQAETATRVDPDLFTNFVVCFFYFFYIKLVRKHTFIYFLLHLLV